MTKSIKILLLIAGVAFVFFLVISVYLFSLKHARVKYSGYVEIEPTSLSLLKDKLEEIGCRSFDYKNGTLGTCRYGVGSNTFYGEKKNVIVVNPYYGIGFGPTIFYLLEDNKLWDNSTSSLPVDGENFKEKVRKDVKAIHDIVSIKEGTWVINKNVNIWGGNADF